MKGQFKFEIIVVDNETDKDTVYVWKTKNQTTRDEWVNGIMVHIKYLQSTVGSS